MSIRVRLYLDGRIAAEDWIAVDDEGPGRAGALAVVHRDTAEGADAAGRLWCVEIYDPDAPDAVAYTRYGSDRSLIPDGELVDPADIAERVIRNGHYARWLRGQVGDES